MQSVKQILLIESDGNPEKKTRIRQALRYAAAAGAGAVATGLVVRKQGQNALKKETESHDSTKKVLKYVDNAAKETSKENTELKGRVGNLEADHAELQTKYKDANSANTTLSDKIAELEAGKKAQPKQLQLTGRVETQSKGGFLSKIAPGFGQGR